MSDVKEPWPVTTSARRVYSELSSASAAATLGEGGALLGKWSGAAVPRSRGSHPSTCQLNVSAFSGSRGI
jgi:hypothetical protein